MQRLAGSSLLEGTLVDWVVTRPAAEPRLPVAFLNAEEKAAELQRIQAERAKLSAREAEVMLGFAADRPDDRDPQPGTPGAASTEWRQTDPEFPGVSESFPDELAMVIGVARGTAAHRLRRAWTWRHDLPATFAALRRGRNDCRFCWKVSVGGPPPAMLAAAPAMAEAPKVLLSPRGAPFGQARARQLAAGPGVVLVCGRFEGVDERVVEAHAMEEISVGDFVLSGGEIAAMAVMDCCVRLLPGVMGEPTSANEESFEDGLLEYPHYTRPASWTGPDGTERRVPEVLVSGHHGKVAEWRRRQREEITRRRRPDLWAERTAKMNREK